MNILRPATGRGIVYTEELNEAMAVNDAYQEKEI